jgi:hypothetical protein
MVWKLLFPAAIVFNCFVCGPAKADVTYTFFDESSPATVDLEFTVATQLTTNLQTEDFLSVGGAYGPDFDGGKTYLSVNPINDFGGLVFEPPSSTSIIGGGFQFNVVGGPGNGDFAGEGEIYAGIVTLATLGSASVSGVAPSAIPEPAAWVLLSFGFLGLATLRLRSKGGGRLVSGRCLSGTVAALRLSPRLPPTS